MELWNKIAGEEKINNRYYVSFEFKRQAVYRVVVAV